jgi:hypothetical protein
MSTYLSVIATARGAFPVTSPSGTLGLEKIEDARHSWEGRRTAGMAARVFIEENLEAAFPAYGRMRRRIPSSVGPKNRINFRY